MHLVGHSYGGALALHIARCLPERIASLSLYEPTSFQVLTGDAEGALLRGLGRIGRGSPTEAADAPTGAEKRDSRAFVAFWSGVDAWSQMSDRARAEVTGYIRKGPAELAALMCEPADSVGLDRMNCPVLLLRGSDVRNPAAIAAARLAGMIPRARLIKVEEAGHVGPLTHAAEVAAAIALNILQAEADAGIANRKSSGDREVRGAAQTLHLAPDGDAARASARTTSASTPTESLMSGSGEDLDDRAEVRSASSATMSASLI